MANLSNINNKFIVTDGNNGRVLIGATNDIGATLFANHPSTTAPSLTFNAPAGQVFENEDLQIAFGLNNASPYNGYMQTRFVSAPYYRNLAINPLGGNVGIGTNSPSYPLEVNGQISISSTTGPQLLFFEPGRAYTDGMRLLRYQDKLSLTYGWNANEEALTVVGGTGSDVGNVGIGTTSPAYKLDVNGVAFFRTELYLINTTARMYLGSGTGYCVINKGPGITGTATRLYFGEDSDSGLTMFRGTGNVTVSSANVGIGTDSPATKLQVEAAAGQATTLNNSVANSALRINADTANGSNNIRIGESGSGSYFLQVSNSAGTTPYAINLNPFGGKVGIGTTSPNNPLTVAGNLLVTTTVVDGQEDRFKVVGGGAADAGNVYVYNDTQSATIRLNSGGASYFTNGLMVGYTSGSYKVQVLEESTNTTNIGVYTNVRGAGTNNYAFYADAANGTSTNFGFYGNSGKNAFLGDTGIGTDSPVNKLEAKGLFAAPLTTGSAQNGIARFSQTSGVGSLDIGFGDPYSWLQSRSSSSYATNYNLALNPNGGNVGIGTTTVNRKLTISDSVGSNYLVSAKWYKGASSFSNPFIVIVSNFTNTSSYPQIIIKINLIGHGISANRAQFTESICTYDLTNGDLQQTTISHKTVGTNAVSAGVFSVSGTSIGFTPLRQTNYDQFKIEADIQSYSATFDY